MILSTTALLLLATAGASTATNTKAPPGREVVKVKRCPSLDRAITYYQSKAKGYERKLASYTGTHATRGRGTLSERSASCAYKRYIVKLWISRARTQRKALEKWEYNYAWWKWLPDKWQRIGACETGYGRKPGNFHWNSGTYQGFVGFYYGTWDQYKPAGAPSEAYLATPRQQWQAAENVKAVNGYGAWGCGGA